MDEKEANKKGTKNVKIDRLILLKLIKNASAWPVSYNKKMLLHLCILIFFLSLLSARELTFPSWHQISVKHLQCIFRVWISILLHLPGEVCTCNKMAHTTIVSLSQHQVTNQLDTSPEWITNLSQDLANIPVCSKVL